MRYLRVLTNSAIAGALTAGYLLITTLHLNPEFPLGIAPVAPLAAAFGLAYGVNALVGFYALIVLRQVAAVQVLSPGWLSVRVLAWTSTIAAAAGATVLWLNASNFAPFLAPETARRMTLAAIAVGLCGARVPDRRAGPHRPAGHGAERRAARDDDGPLAGGAAAAAGPGPSGTRRAGGAPAAGAGG